MAKHIKKKRVTIKDVAKESKYSIATVSRVINETGKFYSNDTKKHILDVVHRLGYKTDALAKGLKKGDSGAIAYMVPQIDDFYSAIYRGMVSVANEFSCSVVILNSDYNREQEINNINTIKEGRFDGVVIATSLLSNINISQLSEIVPVVCIDRFQLMNDTPCVSINDLEVSQKATEYLIELGHKSIAFISAPPRITVLNERFMGYKKALDLHEIKFNKEIIFFEESLQKTNYQDCYKMMQRILLNYRKFSAAFIISDFAAFTAIRVVSEIGLKMPDDLSIIGFDNLEFTEFCIPSLTTISQNKYLIGQESARIMMELLEGKEVNNVMIKAELIIRESTGFNKKKVTGQSKCNH